MDEAATPRVTTEKKTTEYLVRMSEEEALAVRAFLGKVVSLFGDELFFALNAALDVECPEKIKSFDQIFEHVGQNGMFQKRVKK